MSIYPDDAVVMAPLAGYTDLPFRESLRRRGFSFAFTEMIDVCSMVYAKDRTLRMARKGASEEWLGLQIVGVRTDIVEKAVEILNDMDFDVLDLNLGCPMSKVAGAGKGAALGAQPEKAAALLARMAELSRRPVTAKIRILHEEDPAPTVDLARRLEAAGAAALTVHGRIAAALYSGPCRTHVIRAVADSVGIQVVANGGVMGRADYLRIRSETGCGPVMVARGAMGNPWILEELRGLRGHPPSNDEVADAMSEHVRGMIELFGEERGMVNSRKIILAYMSGKGFPGGMKAKVCTVSAWAEFSVLLDDIRVCDRSKHIKKS